MKKFIILLLLILNLEVVNASIEDFPMEYQEKLTKLKSIYPNWQFRVFETDLNFNDAVLGESEGDKNLVPINSDYSLKSKDTNDYNINSGTFIEKDRGWVSANKLVISYFMNPLNFLNEKHIMQFELLGYDKNIHTVEGVEEILKGTFMYQTKISYLNMVGDLIETDDTYSSVIMEAARISNVSPYYLASKIRQEIGINKSDSVSGIYPGYEGIYNFYNIGATDGLDATKSALEWAVSDNTNDRPWLSPRTSIIGGAKYISSSYIDDGQTIGYLQKFNVNKNSSYPLYTHQYMTNVAGATSEAANQFNASLSLNNLYNLKVFYIPVYDNMPDMNASVTLNKEADKQTGTINTNNVEIKQKPGTSHTSYNFKLNQGDKVTILGGFRTDSIYDINYLYYPYWYKVTVVKNNIKYTGYINSKYVNVDVSKTIYTNEKYKLDYKINSNSDEIVYFESTNMKVATVDENGIVTPKANGTTTINVYVGSVFESITLNVKKYEILADNLTLSNDDIYLTVGSNKNLTFKITPTNTTNKNITWKSSNSNVVTVSNGKVVAKNPGTAIITASINNKVDTCSVRVSLNKPVITSISSNSYNSLKISYNKINGASGYIIYRANSLNGTYKYIKTVTSNYYIDKNLTNNKKYYYKVRTYKIMNKKKYYYSYSEPKLGIPTLQTTTITSLKKYSTRKIKISFKKISGIDGYIIYRSTSLNSTYKQIKYLNKNTTTYTDSNLKKGVTYYYKIKTYKAVKKKKIYSYFSNTKSLKR